MLGSFLFAGRALSLCVSDFVGFILVQAGSFPEKYPLTVVALRLLGQFRLVNAVLPFGHLRCSWISRVDEGFQGNRTKSSFPLKYVHLVVQPLASSLTKMAAPANNRKQFPARAASADTPLAMRYPACITTRDVIRRYRRYAHVG